MNRPDSNAAEPRLPVSQPVDVSIVVPAFNEEGNVAPLHAEVCRTLQAADFSWEIVFSDDGSSDATWLEIQRLHQDDRRVRGVRLSRNFGHQYALMAGLQAARGRAIISMDSDLQHPPALIPDMVAAWRSGHMIVKTKRTDSEDVGFFKRTLSRNFYRLFSYLSGVTLDPGMADFRLLDRQVLDEILKFREDGLFLRGIVEWVGFKTIAIPYRSANRFSGTTKYTFRKMFRFAWSGVSSFSVVPLRLGSMVGFIASGLSFLGIAYAILSKLIYGHAVPGWASTVAIMSFLFGILFALLGLLGEYLGRVLVEVRQRPRFLVRERLDP